MDLPEAIRQGSLLSKHGTGKFMAEDGATCALGAAGLAVLGAEAKDFINDSDWVPKLLEIWPELKLKVEWPKETIEPGYFGMVDSLRDIIVYLNDRYGWSREKIADWVDEVLRARGASNVACCNE